MKSVATCLAVVFLVAVAVLASPQNSQPIMNFLRINTDICTGGQPAVEQLTALKADGVKTIINLRTPTEYDPAPEIAKVKEPGLRYFSIPVASAGPKDEQVVEFLKLTDDPQNRPAFIHCASANRVGAFWMIRRVLRDNCLACLFSRRQIPLQPAWENQGHGQLRQRSLKRPPTGR